MINQSSPILLFDGQCNLCNAAVRFVLKHEIQPTILFGSLQSEIGQSLLQQHGLPSNVPPTSLVFIENGIAFQRSDAAIRVSTYLSRPWRWVRHARFIPRILRDAIYNFIARYRYRVFGKSETCMLPNPEVQNRFLS